MRRVLSRLVAVVLLIAPSVRQVPHPLQFEFHGPKQRLRLDKNIGWVVQLPVPDPYIDTIGRHVRLMHERGYFRDIVSNDLFHGHLMMKPDAASEYADAGALVKDAVLFVYHTAEFSGRWEREAPAPPAQRNPRSLVGYWDGAVEPAINLIRPGTYAPFYEKFGTISDSELRESRPELFEGWPAVKIVRIGPYARCAADLQFLLLQDPYGRLLIEGRRYDAYIKCEIDPRELGLGGYETRPRPFLLDGGDR